MIRNWRFVNALALAAMTAMCWQGGANARPAERLGAQTIWREPAGARVQNCDAHDSDGRRQLGCVVKIMKATGATERAIAFMRRCSAAQHEICYLAKLQSSGPVSLATIALPFRRNTNAHTDSEFAVMNGDPPFIRVDDNVALRTALAENAGWLRFTRSHKNIDIWEGTTFTGAHALPDGGTRLVFSYPLGEYHAEAGRWNASVVFNFGPDGKFAGRRLLAITGPRQ